RSSTKGLAPPHDPSSRIGVTSTSMDRVFMRGAGRHSPPVVMRREYIRALRGRFSPPQRLTQASLSEEHLAAAESSRAALRDRPPTPPGGRSDSRSRSG